MKPKLRPMRATDRGHVVRSWVASYADSRDAREAKAAQKERGIVDVYATVLDLRGKHHGPADLFHSAHRIVVDRLVHASAVTIACLDEDEDTIVGWRALAGDLLHYVCVKPDHQRHGIGRLLTSDIVSRTLRLTHWSDTAAAMKLPKAWKYDPHALKEALAR